jgi:YtxH-like protein
LVRLLKDVSPRKAVSATQNFSAAIESQGLKGVSMFSGKQQFPVGKIAIAFALGAVSGAVLALLYAPLTGKKMQKKVAGVTSNIIDKVEETVEDAQKTVRRIVRA